MLADIAGRVIAVDAKTSNSGNDYASVFLLQRSEDGTAVVEAFGMKSDLGTYPPEGADVIMRADVELQRGREGRPDRLRVVARKFYDASAVAPAA